MKEFVNLLVNGGAEEGVKADMKTKGGIALTGIVTILAMILVLA